VSTESDIVGRPALLWRLERRDAEPIECLAGELTDRRYRVRILRDGSEHAAETFSTPGAGVKWGLEMERALVEEGWTRVG
jgi:hypothetical protein